MRATWSVWLAVDRPERVRSLALLGCPALIAGSGAPIPFRLLGVPGLNRLIDAMERPTDDRGRKTFARLGHDPGSLPEELTVLQGRTEALPTYRTHWLSLLENMFPWARQAYTLTLEDLSGVRQPVRFVWGERDPFGPPSAGEAACRVMADTQLTALPAGHLPWVDEPDRCAAVVQGLIDHASASHANTSVRARREALESVSI